MISYFALVYEVLALKYNSMLGCGFIAFVKQFQMYLRLVLKQQGLFCT